MSERLGSPARVTAVHGVRIEPHELSEATAQVVAWARDPLGTHSRVVHPLPADPTVRARRDPDFRALLNRSDLNVADGMGVVWAVRLLGGAGPTRRVYGPDLMTAVLRSGSDLRHAFVGGGDAAALDRLLAHVRDAHDVAPAAAHAPPHRDVTAAGVAEDIAALGLQDAADVLWVGLGTPKQHRWADLARVHRPARVIVTVGAAFDFHAGLVRQAPGWMQRAGLEWLHRLGQDPRRLWRRYLVGNARHVSGVAIDVVRDGLARQRSRS